MIRRPIHTVNSGVRPTAGALPTVPGLDLSVAEANVAGWGGDIDVFRSGLARALAADPSSTASPQVIKDLAVVAAWRAGVVGLRGDALRALHEGLAGDRSAATYGVILGLASDEVAGFISGQTEDRFFWPPWAEVERSYLIARIGGFTGLGGPWLARPGEVTAAGEGHWLVEVGADLWELTADLFGHIVAKLSDDDQAFPREPAETHGVRVVSLPTSYLLEIVKDVR